MIEYGSLSIRLVIHRTPISGSNTEFFMVCERISYYAYFSVACREVTNSAGESPTPATFFNNRKVLVIAMRNCDILARTLNSGECEVVKDPDFLATMISRWRPSHIIYEVEPDFNEPINTKCMPYCDLDGRMKYYNRAVVVIWDKANKKVTYRGSNDQIINLTELSEKSIETSANVDWTSTLRNIIASNINGTYELRYVNITVLIMFIVDPSYPDQYDIAFFHNGVIVGKIIICDDNYISSEYHLDIKSPQFLESAYALSFNSVIFVNGILGADLANYVSSLFTPISSNEKSNFLLVHRNAETETLLEKFHCDFMLNKVTASEVILLSVKHFVYMGAGANMSLYRCRHTGATVDERLIRDYIITLEHTTKNIETQKQRLGYIFESTL